MAAEVAVFEPNPTAFDLRFRLFGTPVRVHPTFWLFSAFFGWAYYQRERHLGFLLLWIGCMFLSILVHEFGHITMARIYRRPGHIVLYSFGGLAVGEYELRRPLQRIAVAAAGPAAGLLLYGMVLATERFVIPGIFRNNLQVFADNPMLTRMIVVGIEMLVFMNLLWSLLNLIPIVPLDGGQISRELFTLARPRDGFRLALIFSIVLAGAGAVYSLLVSLNPEQRLPYPSIHPGFAAILLGLLAFENFNMLGQAGRNHY